MKKAILLVTTISFLLWAQRDKIISPTPAGEIKKSLCCGRRVKPTEPRPEKIETGVKSEQKLSEGWAFIILNSNTPQEMNEILGKMEKSGINISGLRWPPHCALIRATKEDRVKILEIKGIDRIYFEEINPDDVPYKDDLTNTAINYWNKLIRGELDENIPLPGIEPIKDDMRIPPQNYRYQSDYMFGSVAACIFFPESNGQIDPNTEDWTTTLRDNVINEVSAGLQRWVTWASSETPPVTLSFSLYYYNYTQTPTRYEPINRNSWNEEGLWINDCMDAIGAPSGTYFERVSWFNNWLKSNYGTDWAHSIFVVNSYNDANGCFPDGYFAYAYLGGPFLVMTYDNDGYGINNMDVVCAHETGHNFYAFDEYSSSNCICTESRNGYENQNCENNCLTNNSCIMRGGIVNAIEYYTKGHVGWDPGVYTLSDDITQSVGYPYPKARKYQYNQSSVYWAAAGVRPSTGSDWDIRLYSDTGFGTLLASSSLAGTAIDFVVADYNHSPTGVDAVYVLRYSGTSGATVEYEDGTESFSYPNSYSATWDAGDVVEIFDYYIGSAPLNLNFYLDITSGSADLGFGLFKSNSASYYAGRSSMVAYADASGPGGDESFNYNVTTNDWYGLIVWANNTSSANYTIRIGLVDIAELNNSEPNNNFNITPNPCRERLIITFPSKSSDKNAQFKIFDATGNLLNEFKLESGVKQQVWDCKNRKGIKIPNGVYFLCYESKEMREIRKLVIIK
ncbi:MAG: T9SS type A sorting domain-containing protein [candidate division WOR-3 bacterium]